MILIWEYDFRTKSWCYVWSIKKENRIKMVFSWSIFNDSYPTIVKRVWLKPSPCLELPSLLVLFLPCSCSCISTGRRCCAADPNTGLNAACGEWDTRASSGGAAKIIIQSHPFPPAALSANWFHLRPPRAGIKVCEAWLHRACTIYTPIPKSVSVISVRCKTTTTPFSSQRLLGQLRSDW